jgi:hypothetical protein
MVLLNFSWLKPQTVQYLATSHDYFLSNVCLVTIHYNLWLLSNAAQYLQLKQYYYIN